METEMTLIVRVAVRLGADAAGPTVENVELLDCRIAPEAAATMASLPAPAMH